MKRKRKRMEKENEERRRQYEKEAKERELQRIIEQEKKAEEFIKNKSKYFDITFCNSNIIVVVLSSFDAYKYEGDTLHHCVFTNNITIARTPSSSPPDSSTPLMPHSKPSNYPSSTATSSNATAPTTKKPHTTTKSSPSSTSTPTSSSPHR